MMGKKIIIDALGLKIELERIRILVYTTPETLEHKKNPDKEEPDEDIFCYWEFKNLPKKITGLDRQVIRLYFATKGRIRGYFTIDDIECLKTMSSRLYFGPESWIEAEDEFAMRTVRPFQGFKYLDKEK